MTRDSREAAVDASTRRAEPLPAPEDYDPGSLEGLRRSVILRFEEMVDRYPDRPAVIDGAEVISYRALNSAANLLARQILEKPFREDAPAAVLLGQNAASTVALMGVLKSGRPYVALDPSSPIQRMQKILASAEPACLITADPFKPVQEQLEPRAVPRINLDDLDLSATAPNPGIYPDPESVFGVFFTSGSTGEPKGVLHTHGVVSHMMLRHFDLLRHSPSDRVSQLAYPGFASAYWNILGALVCGGASCVFDVDLHGPQALLDWIAAERLTALRLAPSLFRSVLHGAPSSLTLDSLRYVKLLGEVATSADFELFRAHTAGHCWLINGLGSTDVGGTTNLLLAHDAVVPEGKLAVGYPDPDMEVSVLDTAGRPVREGEVGEIVVSGRYLPLGYWRDPELTAARFQPDPERPGMRMVHSGDLGRWLPGGILEHVGRKDLMVKVRGQRVELGEIEAVLGRNPEVRQVAVAARPSRLHPEESQLAAYIVPRVASRTLARALREYASRELPDYMVPSFIVFLEALPLTATGKVDRGALPDPPERDPVSSMDLPSDEVERRLVDIWGRNLKLPRLGVNDDYFELGGDSLSVLSMMLDVEGTFGRPVSRAFFKQPTIRALAALLSADDRADDAALATFRPQAGRRRRKGDRRGLLEWSRTQMGNAKWRVVWLSKMMDASRLFELSLAGALRRLTYAEAKERIAQIERSRVLDSALYHFRRRLYERFLKSLAVAAPAAGDLFRTAVISDLLVRLTEAQWPFRGKGSRLAEDRRRLFTEASPEGLDVHATVSGLRHVQDALLHGSGVVLVSYHGAAYDRVAGGILEARLGGAKIQTIAHAMAIGDDWRLRSRSTGRRIQAGALYAELAHHGQEILRRGQIVHMVSDSLAPLPGRTYHAIIGDRRYTLRPGFAELALNTGAAVIPVWAWFDERLRLAIELWPAMEPGAGTREMQVQSLVRQYGEFVTQALRQHPQLSWKKMHNHLLRPRA